MERWKSRKFWFAIVGFVTGIALATQGLLTPTVAGFIVTMSVSYNAGNVVAKRYRIEGG